MRPGEGLLELLQLEAGKGRPIPALFPLRSKVVDLSLTFRARRCRPGMCTILFWSHFLGRNAHLGLLMALACLLVSLAYLGHLLTRLAHAGAARAARRTRL